MTSEDTARSLVASGCRAGETVTRHIGGARRPAPDTHPTTAPFLGELSDARERRPLDRMSSRLSCGADAGNRALHAAAERR
ncbi:hypothetical protein AB0F45_35440 [Streptomyces achromogenes]|uniref:hypothetical protein n=1 Tax=Streptomyces achromogenes TaxID=67255 RepID=UPI003406ED7C